MFWEPWSPRIGQRVRVRACPECPYQDAAFGARYDGVLGVVHDYQLEPDGHNYYVLTDTPIVRGGRMTDGLRCTAAELDPV